MRDIEKIENEMIRVDKEIAVCLKRCRRAQNKYYGCIVVFIMTLAAGGALYFLNYTMDTLVLNVAYMADLALSVSTLGMCVIADKRANESYGELHELDLKKFELFSEFKTLRRYFLNNVTSSNFSLDDNASEENIIVNDVDTSQKILVKRKKTHFR